MKNRTEFYITRALIGLCEGYGDVASSSSRQNADGYSHLGVLQWIHPRCRSLHLVLLQDWRVGHSTVFVLVCRALLCPFCGYSTDSPSIRSSLNLARILSNLLAAAILPMRGVAGKTGWFWLFIIEVRPGDSKKRYPDILIKDLLAGTSDLCRSHLLLLLASRQPG